ncbi:MAG: Holliday junction resolvase RuvX [Victivallales bacterium]|nr:Holliday junction resolvase RuvX [Victivallales bacterium]
MTVLGLDYGTVRIGVALSDFTEIIAHPRKLVLAEPRRDCLEHIFEICVSNDVSRIVVGLPKHMSGDEGDSAVAARKFGAAVADRTSLPVDYIDERLTTVSADNVLNECDVRGVKRKERIDSIAAAIILQNYLDMHA